MFALLFKSAKTEALPAGQKCTLSMCLEDFRLDLQVWWAYRFVGMLMAAKLSS